MSSGRGGSLRVRPRAPGAWISRTATDGRRRLTEKRGDSRGVENPYGSRTSARRERPACDQSGRSDSQACVTCSRGSWFNGVRRPGEVAARIDSTGCKRRYRSTPSADGGAVLISVKPGYASSGSHRDVINTPRQSCFLPARRRVLREGALSRKLTLRRRHPLRSSRGRAYVPRSATIRESGAAQTQLSGRSAEATSTAWEMRWSWARTSAAECAPQPPLQPLTDGDQSVNQGTAHSLRLAQHPSIGG